MAKHVFIKTYGCQMNVYDSHRMEEGLGTIGYEGTGSVQEADVVILNTCHIREKAAEKVYSDLGRLRLLKNERAFVLVVAGCVAQAESEEIFVRAPWVDVVCGPQTYHRLPQMVLSALKNPGSPVLDTDFPVEDKFDVLPEERSVSSVSAFLTIQEGCDKFCTFCVVPYTRGAESSRSVVSLWREAEALVASGVRELTLLGQNVNAYHGEGPDGEAWSLARLIRYLARIDSLGRIRYTTSHPSDMSPDLIEAHGDVPALMPYLHLPIQSGSDKVLKAMNRRHTAEHYRSLVTQLRSVRPDIALSTDLMVGFPFEEDDDFQRTLELVEDVTFANAYSFRYSPRPGTPAAEAPQVPEEVSRERLSVLQTLLDRQQKAFNEQAQGATLNVLFEKEGRHKGQLLGRSPYLQPVHVEGAHALMGKIAPCRVTHIQGYSLFADVLSL